MSVNPEIANALRDINDRIGDDFESSIADFVYTPTAPTSGSDEESRHLAQPGRAIIGRMMAGLLLAGAGAAAFVLAGPTIMRWIDTAEPPAALAFAEPDAESTQRFVVDGNTMYLEGSVPDQGTSDVLESAAVEVVGRDRVINNFEISADAVYNPDQPMHLSVARPVLFNTGAADLDEQYRPLIDLAVDLLEAEQSATLLVVGHTDDVGQEDFNLQLSLSRAEAVAAQVIARGIEADRLTVEGRGETEPLESNDTHEGRAINRRVEFSIIGAFGS